MGKLYLHRRYFCTPEKTRTSCGLIPIDCLQALFKVFDRSNRGTITEAQFFSLLDQVVCSNISSPFLSHHAIFDCIESLPPRSSGHDYHIDARRVVLCHPICPADPSLARVTGNSASRVTPSKIALPTPKSGRARPRFTFQHETLTIPAPNRLSGSPAISGMLPRNSACAQKTSLFAETRTYAMLCTHYQGLPRIHFTEANTSTLAKLFVDRTGCDFGGQVRYKQFMEAVGA